MKYGILVSDKHAIQKLFLYYEFRSVITVHSKINTNKYKP